MKSRGYAVPYDGGHHTRKKMAQSQGRQGIRDIVVATTPPFGSFVTPVVSRTRLATWSLYALIGDPKQMGAETPAPPHYTAGCVV